MLMVETVHTAEGYQVVLKCHNERDCAGWSMHVDAQTPLWRALYHYRDHADYAHREPDVWDAAVTRARGRDHESGKGNRRIETLQLPE